MKIISNPIQSLFLFLTIGLLTSEVSIGWCMADRGYQNISVEKFSEMLEHKDFVLINVHIPYAGEIPKTDRLMPYNKIKQHQNILPADKSAPIVVYCLSGPMGDIAAKKLVELGFQNVFHFEEGMIGWVNKGHRLLYRQN